METEISSIDILALVASTEKRNKLMKVSKNKLGEVVHPPADELRDRISPGKKSLTVSLNSIRS